MKYIIILLITLVGVQGLDAQSLSLFDVDASNFPVMKAKFYAFDVAGKQQRPGVSELTLKENGTPHSISNVNCPPPQPTTLTSSVLVIDVSGSMGTNTNTVSRINLAKIAATGWVNGLPFGESECALTSFDGSNYLNQDFTTNRALLLSAINPLTPQGGTDYDAAFITPMAGGLLVSKAGKYKKILIFLTDGQPGHEPKTKDIIQEANLQNCSIYCITLGMPAPLSVKEIAKNTGGAFFENVTSEKEAEGIYQKIMQQIQGNEPCTVEWQTNFVCKDSILNVELSILSSNLSASSSCPYPLNSIPKLEFTPVYLTFKNAEVGKKKDTVLTITARNYDFTISNITSTNPAFTVDKQNFILSKDQSINLTVSFTPVDSSYAFGKFTFEGALCPSIISISGGYVGKKPTISTLKVTQPNGKEDYVIGGDSLITWEGIPELETVQLEYSNDNEATWHTITSNTNGLRYLWKNIPKPESNQCKVRVKQLGKTETSGKEGTKQFELSGEFGYPTSFSWSPDGTKVVVGGATLSAAVWDVVSGKRLFMLRQHDGLVIDAQWSPDGKKIATASYDKTAAIWEASTGKKLLTLTGHTDSLTVIRWSPDGSRVATGSVDKSTIIWDASIGTKLFTLTGHSAYILTLAWSPDGTKLATASYDTTAIIWDAINGQNLHTLKQPYYAVQAVSWSPDGTKVATGACNGTAIIWDASKGDTLVTLRHGGCISSLSWNPDGSKIVTGSYDRTAIVWDSKTGKNLFTLETNTDYITNVEWSPNGSKIVVSSGYSKDADICNATTGALLFTLTHKGTIIPGVISSKWSPDGSKVITGEWDSRTTVWDANTGIVYKELLYAHNSYLNDIAWSPDGSKVADAAEGGNSIIWDASTGQLLYTIETNQGAVRSICWSPDGSRIAVAAFDTLIIFDVVNGTLLFKLREHYGSMNQVVWSPDGSKIATAGDDGKANIWDAINGTKIFTLDTEKHGMQTVCWSPDSKRVATGSNSGSSIVWDIQTGSKVFTVTQKDLVYDINWSPDGNRVAAASTDFTAVIFDANIGTKLYTLTHKERLNSVKWSPDASKVLTASYDHTAIVWDATSGNRLLTLDAHTQSVNAAEWSPNGSRIMTAGADGFIIIWDAATGEILYKISNYENSVHDACWSPDGHRIAIASFDAAARIWYIDEPKIELQEDKSDTVFNIVTPKTVADDINLKQCLVGDSKDSVVTEFIRNTGLYKCRIDSIYFTGADASAFSLVSGLPKYNLEAGASQSTEFRFKPLKEGINTATITIITQSDTLKKTIIGEGIIPLVEITRKLIDFGKVVINSVPKDTLGVVTIKNISSTSLSIISTRHAGPNDIDFTTLKGGGSFVLKPGDTAKLDLRFSPKAIGRTSGRLLFDYNGIGSPATIQLFGEGVALQDSTHSISSTPNINFDSTCITHPKTLQSVLKNNVSEPIQLLRAEWISNPGNVFTTTLPPQTLAVDSSITIDISFNPTATGIVSAQVRWIADKDTAISNVSGIGKVCKDIPDTVRTTVAIQDITAQAGEKVNLILKLKNSSGLQLSGAPTEWVARIRYNKSILFNVQTNNICLSGTDDSCVIELKGAYKYPQSDTLASIPCVATLGNTDRASLVIEDFQWATGALTVANLQKQNGVMQVTGICEDGGVRLFIPAKNTTSLSTRPNPAQSSIQIQYGLREPLTVTLELLSITGQVVQTIVSKQQQAAGQYTLMNDMSMFGNGIYSLRLTTNKEVLTTRVDVVK